MHRYIPIFSRVEKKHVTRFRGSIAMIFFGLSLGGGGGDIDSCPKHFWPILRLATCIEISFVGGERRWVRDFWSLDPCVRRSRWFLQTWNWVEFLNLKWQPLMSPDAILAQQKRNSMDSMTLQTFTTSCTRKTTNNNNRRCELHSSLTRNETWINDQHS